jgi:shikimate kinase
MHFDEQHFPGLTGLRQSLKKPVVLVGMMGSGKTRLGRKLAMALDLEFYDTDHVIEEKAGYSINEIFQNDGEAKFRAVERKVIMDLIQYGPCVIASGGGTVTGEGVMDALKEKTISIWLNADSSQIIDRLKDAKDRPLLKSGDPGETLKKLMAARQPYYSQADIMLETDDAPLEDSLRRMIKALSGFLKEGRV